MGKPWGFMRGKAAARGASGAAPADDRQGVAEYLLQHGADGATALSAGTAQRTYAQLRDDVATLSRALIAAEWEPRTPVAIMAPNGAFWAAAYLAIMHAGHVAVPLPTTLPVDEALARVRWVGAAGMFLGGRAIESVGPAASADVDIFTETTRDSARVPWVDRPRPRIDLDDDAAYLFTSGTTGTPRAVRLTHRNIIANTESILGYLHVSHSDRALVVLPYTYVFGASVLHTHLRVGATLVEQTTTAYPETTVNLLESEKCTVFAAVPSIFHGLLRNSSFTRRRLPHLRIIQQAGGRLPPALLRELLAADHNADVFVMYGQTEATARLSALDPALLLSKPGSIGRGIPGVRLRVIDEEGQRVAPGEIGEIWARGENISPGYLADPEGSAAKMPDGELHTGDLATIDDEGFIYVVDRAEDFIKSWGYRVASQEVEAAAMELPDLVAVAAVGLPDEAAGERVELLAVARRGSDVTAEQVIARCRELLPKYAVPARVRFADQLPLNANGKVVKRDVRDLLMRTGTVG
ncbi:class I adenylate-forming enzyme family protein [Microbacterium sp. 70-16]